MRTCRYGRIPLRHFLKNSLFYEIHQPSLVHITKCLQWCKKKCLLCYTLIIKWNIARMLKLF